MPWILLPILASIALGLSVRLDEYSRIEISKYTLIPIAVFLGIRYGTRGVVTIFIAASALLLTPMTGQVELSENWYFGSGGGDISLWLSILMAASIGAYENNIYEIETEARIPLWPVFFILLFSVKLGNSYAFGPTLAILYLFIKGWIDYQTDRHDEKMKVLFILSLSLLIISLLTAKYIIPISEEISLLNPFSSLQIVASLILAYFVGFYFRDEGLFSGKSKYYLILLIVLSSFAIQIQSDLSIFPERFFLIGGYVIPYFIALYSGSRISRRNYRELAISCSILTITFLSFHLIPLKRYDYSINDWSYIIYFAKTDAMMAIIFFMAAGFFFNSALIRRDYIWRELLSLSSHKIKSYFFISFLILPISVTYLMLSDAKETIDVNITEMNYSAIFGEILQTLKLKNLLVISLFFVSLYIFIILVQIGIASLIVKRNGILFNRNNFPKYSMIHDIIQSDFGDIDNELYIVSTNKLGLWKAMTERFLKTYDAILPMIPSSVFNETTKYDERQLLFLVYRSYVKVKLKHYRLWWFLYPLSLVPFVNFIYTYGRRTLFLNMNLYAYHKLKNLNAIDLNIALSAVATEETEAGIERIDDSSIQENIQRHHMSLWIEYFSPRPHLQTILNTIKKYDEYSHLLNVSQNELGLVFKER